MKRLILGAVLSGMVTGGAWAQAEDAVFPIICWTYYSFEKAQDLDFTVDSWVQMGITHPMAPSVGPDTDKAKFRQFLDKCHAAGLKMILTDRRNGPGAVHRWLLDKNDPEGYRTACRAVAADWNDHPAVYGYYVFDEPMANQKAGAYAAARIARKEMGGKMILLNQHPWHVGFNEENLKKHYGTTCMRTWLDEFRAETGLEWLGYDCYQQQDPGTNGLAKCFYNLREWDEFARATGQKWNVTMLCTEHFNYLIRSDIDFRWQLSVGAAMGANAINWFYPDHHGDGHGNYRNAPINQIGRRTQTLEWMGQEILVFQRQYGALFAQMKHEGAYITSFPYGGMPLFTGNDPDVKGVRLSGDAKDPMLVSFFRDAKGVRYVVVVNLNKEIDGSRRIVLDLAADIRPALKMWDHWKPLTGKTHADVRVKHYYNNYLAPGQMAFIRLAR